MLKEKINQIKNDKEKRKVIIIIATSVACILLAVWGFFYFKTPQNLNDLSYTVNKQHGYTVYLKEETGYRPYLVITNNYDGEGTVLLLRKYTLDKFQPFNIGEFATSYYEDSYIDKYLNSNYLKTLSSTVQKKIINEDILIQSESTWTGGGPRGEPETKSIRRKVFLLSYAELTGPGEGFVKDGKPLKYFRNNSISTPATDARGEPVIWTLRSGGTESKFVNLTVSPTGAKGTNGGVYQSVGVRPAFRLSRTVEVEKSTTVIKGETVFVLKDKE